MPEYVERSEFNQSLNRIHTRVDEIAKVGIQIETSAKIMEKSVSDMHTIIYGNGGKKGLKEKFSAIISAINIQWYLLGLVIAGLIGTAWIVIRK